jgi:hypothetical protein
MEDADAIIHALSVLLAEYGKQLRITGDGLRAVKATKKLHVSYDKEVDTYTFSSSER